MKTYDEAKALLSDIVRTNDVISDQDGCSLCCSSHGGGKARYQ